MSKIASGDVRLPTASGDLYATFQPPNPGCGLVIFAHGSGSSRLSPRNQFVAQELGVAGFGTLLLDLLTVEEDRVYENRFDIPLLAERLKLSVAWALGGAVEHGTPVAFFGASTGAAAALIAAAELGTQVATVVSRGGRPDLAGEALSKVRCPTLFIVGELDREVLALNRAAMARMPDTTYKQLEVVSGATHLFEEPGTLEQVAKLAVAWFRRFAMVT